MQGNSWEPPHQKDAVRRYLLAGRSCPWRCVVKRTRVPRLCLFLTAGLICAVNAQASQEIPYKGKTVSVLLDSTEHELPDGRTIYRDKRAGFLVADDHDHPLHLMQKTCRGSVISADGGQTWQGSGFCEHMDSNGNAIWEWWEGDQSGGTWGYTRGTGKYKGVRGSGIWKPDVSGAYKGLLHDGKSIVIGEGVIEVQEESVP